MRFKEDIDKEVWYQWVNKNPAYTPFMRLRRIISVIDDLSTITGHGEIIVTSFLRPADIHSYHSKGHAVDIRVRDKTPEWYEAMIVFKEVLRILDWQVQLVPHLELYNKDHQHMHIEIDDNSLKY